MATRSRVARPNFTVVTLAPAQIQGDRCTIDRKFHSGILRYAELLDARLTCLAPSGPPPSVDVVTLDRSELGYSLLAIPEGGPRTPMPEVDRVLSRTDLLYGMHPEIVKRARRMGVPYVLVTEHSLRVRLALSRINRRGLRGVLQQARSAVNQAQELAAIRHAHGVHCNGYPAYHAARRVTRSPLLYLDSRMRRDQVISERALQKRLDGLDEGRPYRLFFSGRFEPIKGPVDVIDVARHLAAQQLPFELHFYGDGSLTSAMHARVRHFGLTAQVQIHRPVPYPELERIAKGMDLFVCCHPQGDPSCTYLETFGAGVPVAGYANAMWKPLCQDSRAGVTAPVGQPRALASAASALLLRHGELHRASHAARDFALGHDFDRESARRIDHLLDIFADLPRRDHGPRPPSSVPPPSARAEQQARLSREILGSPPR